MVRLDWGQAQRVAALAASCFACGIAWKQATTNRFGPALCGMVVMEAVLVGCAFACWVVFAVALARCPSVLCSSLFGFSSFFFLFPPPLSLATLVAAAA